MEQQTYNELKQQHSELEASRDILEERILRSKDETAMNLLRADYRGVIMELQSIYDQLISFK